MNAALELAKPRITLLVALCAACGYYLAPDAPGFARMIWTLLGVALASASTGCLNQVLEAEQDGRMERTRRRPIPSGRVGRGRAALLGAAWGAAGLAVLAIKTTPAACALTALTLAGYLLIYTPMKRRSPLALWVGAIPGALPPVIGWAATGAPLDARAAALFAVQFLWQIPHFLSLAWVHRDDYVRGGFKLLAEDDANGKATARQLLVSAALLAAAAATPYLAGLAGFGYLAGAAALSAWFVVVTARAARAPSRETARRVFLASLAYLPAVQLLLVLGR